MKPALELSRWDRLVRALAHPVRLLAWIVALGVVTGPYGGPSWVLTAALGAMVGAVAGELLGRSRLRTFVILGGALGLGVVTSGVRGALTGWAWIPGLFGPVFVHWAGLLLGLGTTVATALVVLRTLARRGPAFEIVELGLLGALLTSAVAAHRDGSIARPLWLSDLSWSFGVDPGRVLLVGGAGLTLLLAALLLLASERRKPVAGLAALPVLALVALLLALRLPALEPPDPEEQLGMGAMGDDSAEGGSEGGEESSNGEGGEGGGGGKSDEPPDPLDPPPSSSSSENRPVAVVLLDDDHEPPSGYWYLRQEVLPAFNGSRLVASEVDGTHRDVLDHFPTEPEQVELAPTEGRKTVRGSVSLLVDHPVPFAPASAVAFAPRGNPDPARFERSYHFASAMLEVPYTDLALKPVGDPLWDASLRSHYLETPDDARYGELAEQIVTDLRAELGAAPDQDLPPFLKAVAVVQYIGDNMEYTKRERHAGVPDPTADFLFGNRRGYCVHTAHAATYLWRTLGIPARVGTGYAVEESFRRGGTLVVMAGDAHAWPELYLQDVGWVPLDVAPAVDLDQAQGMPPDEEEMLALGDLARRLADLPGPQPDHRWIWTWLGRTATGLVSGIVLFVLLAHYFVKIWRRSRPLWAPPTALSRVGFRAALDVLTEAGLVREPGETREAFARRHAETLPALARLTELHLRGAFGRPQDDDPERDRILWTGTLARLHHELRAVTPLWRRLLGLVDPTTPYRSR